MVLVVALILDYLQVQNLGFQTVKKEGHVPALLRKYKSQEPEFDCLRANEEETEDSQRRESILSIALQQKIFTTHKKIRRE